MHSEQPATEENTSIKLVIVADVSKRITFASFQCAVPLIRDLVLRNPSITDYQSLTLRLTTDPEIVGSKTWTIDRLLAGAELRMRDRDVFMKGGLLQSLNESMRVSIRFELLKNEEVLAEAEYEVRALARNEWGGASHMPELLAAFVMPNDPAVSRLLKSASQLLEKQGKPSSLEGYQRKERTRVWELAAAVWAAVASRQLTYAEPPASFELQGQKVRTPSDIEDQGLATCLDSALLFASALEQIGLNAVMAFTQGHVFTGVWLQPQAMPQLMTEDAMELRKAVVAKELVLFETTRATGPTPFGFSQAILEANRQIAEERESRFVYAIDLKQARNRQIQPLPSRITTHQPDNPEVIVENNPAIETPPEDLPGFDFGLETEPVPDTAQGRLDHWKRKLLDLSKRNRMLNLRPSKTAIAIFCPAPAQLEDKLADGKSVSFITPLAREQSDDAPDEEIILFRTGNDFAEEFARNALDNNQVVAQANERDLQSGLTELYRKAKLDLEEGGANTLFLALGMLRWCPSGDKRSYRAPLILLPVKIDRASALSKFKLKHHEDDAVFNLTLLELLRQEFHVNIPGLSEELPRDDSGIDVALIWQRVRDHVRNIPGFEVVPEVVLSTFSFAKFLMWKDLSERTEELKQNSFVRHLIDTPREPYGNSAQFLDPARIDQLIDPANLYMPLNADSSQIVAVNASAQGGDFVLEGPPGTGKSETIGNILAHNLALGRRVLFVSEKMAALEVVYRRLRDHGLGDFCLELHSSKANKKDVIAQLDKAWEERLKQSPEEWERKAAELKLARDRLNGLVMALHAPGETGISPRRALGRVVRFADAHQLNLSWGPHLQQDDRAKTRDGLQTLLQLAHDVGRQFNQLLPDDFGSLSRLEHHDWSFAWQDRVLEEARTVLAEAETLSAALSELLDCLGLAFDLDSREPLYALAEISKHFASSRKFDLGFGLSSDAPQLFSLLQKSFDALVDYRTKRSNLSQPYRDKPIRTAPISQWQAEWSRVSGRIWPLNRFGQTGVRKQMAAHFSVDHAGISAEEDFTLLEELQATLSRIDKVTVALQQSTPWGDLETNVEEAKATIVAAKALRESMIRLAGFDLELDDVRSIFLKRFVKERELLEPGMRLPEVGRRFVEALHHFDKTARVFLVNVGYETEADWIIPNLMNTAKAMLEKSVRLRPWCQWVEVRRQAEADGLAALVTALQSGSLKSADAKEATMTAYCAWLAPKLIDSREELRTFSPSKHDDTIASFRKMDKELAEITGAYIRARLSTQVPGRDDITQHVGYSVLRREINKKAKHLPVRRLVNDMGSALLSLTPCLLMSPLSVAQYLSTKTPAFDLVVFDEASQITVWDAIGAIARGKRAVIVGDPKQMPPSNFFEKGADDGDEDVDGTGFGADMESILDEAMTASVKLWRLTGHYRSRHESLIAFSNHAYYGNELVTYPSSETRDSAVSLRKVDGIYGKGKDRTNPIEAKAVVAEILRRLRDPDLCKLSIGVVTLNSEQQRLILDLLDDARRKDESLEPFFNSDAEESVFVKNLETVQGDQRDVILLSISYGPTEPGAQTMSMNFGPLNRQGGERRLNVAITRATTEVIIFASFDSSMVDLSRTQSVAVRDLKHYLDYAARGPIALGEAIRETGGSDSYDSDFEFVVAEGLRRRGWNIQTQIGVSKFRIDLGVVHPEQPGRYLAGVECDGATYHSMPCARDRDRVRHAILERLDWKLVRIWSTDFFLNPVSVLDRVHQQLTELLMIDKHKVARKKAETELLKNHEIVEATSSESNSVVDLTAPETEEGREAAKAEHVLNDPFEELNAGNDVTSLELQHTDAREYLKVASGAVSAVTEINNEVAYSIPASQLPELDLNNQIAAERFYEPGYLYVIAELGSRLIDTEGPITFKLVSERIARTHGFQRTGSEIKSVVWTAIQRLRLYTVMPDGQKVFWPEDQEPTNHVPFRGLILAGKERFWNDVSYPEKLGLVLEVIQTSPQGIDIPALCASRLGLGRLRASTREELGKLEKELRNGVSDSA